MPIPRTILLALATTALVASTVAAANFDINAADPTLDDGSTGTSSAAACTDGLRLDVVHGDYDTDADDWPVTAVRVTHTAAPATSILDVCLDRVLRIAIDDGGTNLTVTGPVVLNTNTVTAGIVQLPILPAMSVWVSDANDLTATLDTDLPAIDAARAIRDLDGDGITDAVELTNGTDPNDPDTDNDGTRDDQDAFPLDPTRSSEVIEHIPSGHPDQYHHTGNDALAQRFTAPESGMLKALELHRHTGGPSTFTVTVRSGSHEGAVLSQQGNVVVPNGWTRIDLDIPVPVIAGQEYWWRIDGNPGGFQTWAGTSCNRYLGNWYCFRDHPYRLHIN